MITLRGDVDEGRGEDEGRHVERRERRDGALGAVVVLRAEVGADVRAGRQRAERERAARRRRRAGADRGLGIQRHERDLDERPRRDDRGHVADLARPGSARRGR